MSVLFIILPLAIGVAGVAVFAFLIAVKRGQYDDLDTPPWRVLFGDETPGSSSKRNP